MLATLQRCDPARGTAIPRLACDDWTVGFCQRIKPQRASRGGANGKARRERPTYLHVEVGAEVRALHGEGRSRFVKKAKVGFSRIVRTSRVCVAGPVATLVCAATKKPVGPDVLVVSDVLVEAPASLRPTPDTPIYYVLIGGMERTLGDSIAGEKMPKREEVARKLMTALATQGFQRTQVGGPIPTLAIVFTYGSANDSAMEVSDTDPDSGETTTSTITFNQREIARLVGADKASRQMLMSSEAERINDAARDDRLYVFIAALDAVALAKKEKKPLWRTRISIESRRRTLPESLAVVLASAAPHFGTQTDLTVFVEDGDRRRTDVQVGTPVVIPSTPPAP